MSILVENDTARELLELLQEPELEGVSMDEFVAAAIKIAREELDELRRAENRWDQRQMASQERERRRLV